MILAIDKLPLINWIFELQISEPVEFIIFKIATIYVLPWTIESPVSTHEVFSKFTWIDPFSRKKSFISTLPLLISVNKFANVDFILTDLKLSSYSLLFLSFCGWSNINVSIFLTNYKYKILVFILIWFSVKG